MLESVWLILVLAVAMGCHVQCVVEAGSGSGSELPVHSSETPSPAADRTVVELLVMLPLSSSSSPFDQGLAEWDRGKAILPAAQLAVEQINMESSLLSDCLLQLYVVDIESCEADRFASNFHALVPFANISSQPERNVLGVVGGPFCPQLLIKLVSPLSSTRRSRLFQMFGSTSPIARKQNSTMAAHFITPSTQLYYQTVREMMGVLNWTRLLIIADSFFDGATNTFASQGLNVTFRQFFSSSSSLFSLFQDIRRFERNTIFVSVSARDAAAILCQAEVENLVHPHYVWIFHDLTLPVILSTSTCSNQTLERALNGTFFLEFPLRPFAEGTKLVSGLTYTEYFANYTSRLPNGVPPSPYANVLYDSVWAFAATLNSSLATGDYTLQDYLDYYGRQSLLDLMDSSVSNVSLEGASGSIDFSRDPASDGVKIYWRWNGSTRLVGSYHNSSNISILEEVVRMVPNDTLASVYALVPVPLTAILVAVMLLCLLLTTIVLALFIYYREDSDVKAASPYLSYLMFLGCYLLLFATLTHAITGAIVIHGVGKLVSCWAVIGSDSLGVNLIFTTLLLRMLRIYRVFSAFRKTGKLWSNKNMAFIVGVVVVLELAFIVVWSVVDTFKLVDLVTYQSTANPPYYQLTQFCQSEYLGVWLGILLGKVGLLFVVVLFLAIKTRKIKRENFKDTKKVNGYMFSTVMVVITMMSLYFLFRSTKNLVAAHLMVYLAFGITAFLCQLFLFVPKVTSPLLKKCGYEFSYNSKKRRRTLTKKQPPPSLSRTALTLTSQYTNML